MQFRFFLYFYSFEFSQAKDTSELFSNTINDIKEIPELKMKLKEENIKSNQPKLRKRRGGQR